MPDDALSGATFEPDGLGDDELPSIASLIGENLPEKPEFNLTDNQKKNIVLLSQRAYLSEMEFTAQTIWTLWAKERSELPENAYTVSFNPGRRPSINAIQEFMRSADFAVRMDLLGIVIDKNDTGLTAEQNGLLVILANTVDGKSLKQKVRSSGVAWPTFQAWLKNPVFREQYRKLAGNALRDMIPAAEMALAAKMADGDPVAIKYGFELTGHYDPANKKQVDAVNLVQVILETLEEEIKDEETLRRIGRKIQMRGMLQNPQMLTGDS